MVIRDAKLRLNSALLDITQVHLDRFSPKMHLNMYNKIDMSTNNCILQLYEEYAEPLQLWECKLAIIHCSGHQDVMLIQGIWINIIETGKTFLNSVKKFYVYFLQYIIY